MESAVEYIEKNGGPLAVIRGIVAKCSPNTREIISWLQCDMQLSDYGYGPEIGNLLKLVDDEDCLLNLWIDSYWEMCGKSQPKPIESILPNSSVVDTALSMLKFRATPTPIIERWVRGDRNRRGNDMWNALEKILYAKRRWDDRKANAEKLENILANTAVPASPLPNDGAPAASSFAAHRGRGRPKSQAKIDQFLVAKSAVAPAAAPAPVQQEAPVAPPSSPVVKRGRGRPRKTPVSEPKAN